MQVIGDVKCYHCGHISGQVEGARGKRLVIQAFRPRPGYEGDPPAQGERIRCERCSGPVYLEDLRAFTPEVMPMLAPTATAAPAKRSRSSKPKAA
jgi:hypothetical protein